MHLLDTFLGDIGIIIGLEQSFACLIVPDLKVRQVYVDQAIHKLEAFQTIKGTRVVHDRDIETHFPSRQDRQSHLWNHMLGCHKFLGRQVKSDLLVRNVVVLTKDAAHIASTEEDGARTIVALEARLLAEMGRNG
ncbi:hypothetical protein KCU88_g55, partial [Aureobasidium melanogenum]